MNPVFYCLAFIIIIRNNIINGKQNWNQFNNFWPRDKLRPQYVESWHHQCVYHLLYNNPSNSRVLIASRLWSIRGQTHRWRQRSIQVFLNFFEIWICTNHSSLLSIATNQFASFFIDIRSRQYYFRVCQSGENWNQRGIFLCILIFYYIKQIDSMLPCVCSVIDHRGRQNVVRTSVTRSAAPRDLWSITEQTHGNMESIC